MSSVIAMVSAYVLLLGLIMVLDYYAEKDSNEDE